MVVIDMDLEVLKVSSLVSSFLSLQNHSIGSNSTNGSWFRDLQSNWREERAGSFQDCLSRPRVH